jgi:hypothetical protein
MVDLGSLSSFAPAGINLAGMLSTVMTLVLWGAIAIGGVFFVKKYLEQEKYNYRIDIWRVQQGSAIPIIERDIKAGYFINKVKNQREFRTDRRGLTDLIYKIDPKHIIKDGKKYRLFFRLEGDRYCYSFIPKAWRNKKGEKVIKLEVEDGSIVSQAISKDRLIRERHQEVSKLKQYEQLLISMMVVIVLILLIYYVSGAARDAMSEVAAMRTVCLQSGGWLIGLLPTKWLKKI